MVVKSQHVLCVRQIQCSLFTVLSQVYPNENLKVVILTKSRSPQFYVNAYYP